MQKIPTGGSPSTNVPAGTQFGASGVTSLTKGVEALSEAVTKALGSLGERVEAIEKTRQPSTSVDGDGDTDTTHTEKSIWSGVL